MAAMLGYGRAPAPLESRYTIFLVLFPLLNLACLFRVRAAWWLRLGWVALLGVAVLHHRPGIAAGIAYRRAAVHLEQANVAAFLRTGDPHTLDKRGQAIPYPNPVRLAFLLRWGMAAEILPPSLRLVDRPEERWRKRMAKAGTGSALAGLVLLALALAPRRRAAYRLSATIPDAASRR